MKSANNIVQMETYSFGRIR